MHSERDANPDGLVYTKPNCNAYAVVLADPLRDADCVRHRDRVLLWDINPHALVLWHTDVHSYPVDDPVSVLHRLRVPDAHPDSVADAIGHSDGVSNEQCIAHADSLRCSDAVRHVDPNDDLDE